MITPNVYQRCGSWFVISSAITGQCFIDERVLRVAWFVISSAITGQCFIDERVLRVAWFVISSAITGL
jgi:hypothetical protein